ncbi:hypothetical protein HYH03_005976 [Edaphochlamys debaryana]|uniref:OTU domain-containing protein n=1 Tax=Edaphochlamys debaryana TaxID=47281 RepID=A0A835Y6N0_9CHLO|nr:hypothetical protein HYH03_005976 [Edaphochlamys debaryana]|eukprot:KAG2496057.1 hypothetical protein HYH03_005976 [Edaphochlamys debaryana]
MAGKKTVKGAAAAKAKDTKKEKQDGGKDDKKKERAKKWRKSDPGDDLASELAALGLRIKDITGDGNCFFRALGDQLHGDEGVHPQLRHRVVSYMVEHEEDFAPFVEDDESFGTYVARMKKDGTWAGYMEVVGASRCLEANLTIYQSGQPRWRVINHDESTAPMLHLSYHDGQHYNSVRMKDDYSTGPPAPIVLTGDGTIAARPQRTGDGRWDERDERQVAASTACTDTGLVRKALEDAGGDVDLAIEKVIEALAAAPATEADAAGGEGVSAAATVAGAGSAGTTGADGGGARKDGEASPSVGAGTAGPTAGDPAASASAGTEPTVAGGGGASTGTAAAPAPASDPKPPSVPAATPAAGTGDDVAGGAGPRKKGVAVRKAGAAAGAGAGSASAPSNNKPCPCGSRKKYKACCGAAAAAAGRRKAAAGEKESGRDAGSEATVVVAQVAALVI